MENVAARAGVAKTSIYRRHANRGELLLEHKWNGMELRTDYARETLAALVRAWKRPVLVATRVEGKNVLLRFDGKEHATIPYKV